jgi:metallo-beta-lactamase class B
LGAWQPTVGEVQSPNDIPLRSIPEEPTMRSFLAILATIGLGTGVLFADDPPSPEELAKSPELFLATARKTLKWDEPAEPAHLVGPIYFVGTKGLAVYLITTSAGHLVLNTGMPGSGPMIAASIRKLGFKPEDIRILLTGHAHIDHAGGHAYLQKLSGAKVAMIRQERELMESGGTTDFHYGSSSVFSFEPAKVDSVFADGDQIKLGDVTLTAMLGAGHTRGSTIFATRIKDGDQEFSVLFPNSASINPGYRLVQNPSYPGIADDYRRTLETLESLHPDIWLMPHTDSFGYEAKLSRSAKEGARAWVDPEGYRNWVSGQRQKFDATVGREMMSQ